MVQTEGFGQTEESIMRHHNQRGTEEKKGDSSEKNGEKGLIKSASSNSSIGGIIGGNTLNDILNSAQLRETEGTPDKAADMSAIRVNNFPFRGIMTRDGERAQRNLIKEVAFSANSTKST